MNDDLRALFAKYGTDKLDLAHVYHALLYLRRHDVRSVLEIDIGAMCSMQGYAAAQRERHLIHDITGHQECLFVGREDPIAVIFAHPLSVNA